MWVRLHWPWCLPKIQAMSVFNTSYWRLDVCLVRQWQCGPVLWCLAQTRNFSQRRLFHAVTSGIFHQSVTTASMSPPPTCGPEVRAGECEWLDGVKRLLVLWRCWKNFPFQVDIPCTHAFLLAITRVMRYIVATWKAQFTSVEIWTCDVGDRTSVWLHRL